METACVAPFFQALIAHERLSTRVTFTGHALRSPFSITLEDARVTHVDLGLVAPSAGRLLPLVTVGISASHVVVGDTSGSIVQAGTAERARVHAFRASSPPTTSANIVEAWTRRGVDAAIHLATSQPTRDETFHIRRFHLSAAWASSRAGSGAVRILLDSAVWGDTNPTRSGVGWLESHTLLNQAVLLLNAQDGTTGITIWLKGAEGTRSETRGRSPAGTREGTITLAIRAAALTVTDIASGRTATMP